MSATTDKNKAIIRRYVDEVINQHNLDLLSKYIPEDSIDHAAPPGMPGGVAGAKMFLGMMFNAFPDAYYHTHDIVAEGDTATIIFSITGTHTGPFMGIPPTGRMFEVPGVETLHIVNGMYAEHWGGIDNLSLMSQLGLMERQLGQTEKEKSIELAERYIEGINTDNMEMLSSVFSDNFIDHQTAPGGGLGNKKADVMKAHQMLHDAFPDAHFTLNDVLVDGDKVVMRITAEGTHEGLFFGIPPSGKRIKWTGMRLLRVANDQFIEGTSELDTVGILQQMGLIPSFAPPVDPAANAAVIEQFYEAFNRGDLAALDELAVPGLVIYGDASGPLQRGSDALKITWEMLRAAFPDLTATTEELVADGDRVAARVRYNGTHQGNFMGAPGTGKPVKWTEISVNRIENGKLVERWQNVDLLAILQGVGLAPTF